MTPAGARQGHAVSLATTLVVLAVPWVALVAAAGARPEDSSAALSPGWFAGCASSLIVAWFAVGAALGAGIPMGAGLVRIGGRRWGVLAACVPILVPVYVLGLGWNALLTGLPDELARWVGANLLHTRMGAGATLGLWASPIVALAILGAQRRRDPERAEAARMLGGWRARVGLAASDQRPALLGASAAVFALALVEPTVPYLYRLDNPDLEVQAGTIMRALSTRRDALAAMVAAAPLTVIALALLSACALALRGVQPVTRSASPMAGSPARGLLAGWPLGIALLVTAAPPLGALARTAILGGSGALVTLGDMPPLALESALVAIAAAAIALPPALVVGNALARAHTPRSGPLLLPFLLLVLLLGPMMVPAGVPGLGLLRLCNRPGLDWLYDGPAIVALTQGLVVFPVMAILAWAAFARVPRRAEEEARVLGLSAWATLLHVRLRDALPGVLVALGIGCLLAMAELPGTSVALPAGMTTLPFHVMQLAHNGTNHDLATAALTQVVAALAIAGLSVLARALGALAPTILNSTRA